MISTTDTDAAPLSSHASAECKPLLDIATKELFRTNAFRITGMPVDATSRDLAKHAEKLKVLAELGQDPQPNAAFPLRPPPTLEDIRDAIQKLKDPEKRLIEEFFWFWPQDFGESSSDPAIQALQRGDLQIAADIWMSERKHPAAGIVATHNLALIFHIEALSWENYSLTHEVDSKRRADITEYWKAAFHRWNQILTNEQFWEKILTRVRQLNEPRLTTGFVRRMRGTAAMALIKINAEMAVGFAEVGKSEIARLHTDLMDRVKEGASHVANVVEVVLTPARKRLQEHVRHARQAGDANPGSAIAAARDLLDNTRGTLSVFDLFINKNAQFRNDAFDEIAETCNRLQVTYHKATNDNETCLEFLKIVLPLVASQDLRELIESNVKKLTENIEDIRRDKKFYGNLKPISSAPSLGTINGFGLKLYGSTDVDASNGSHLATYYFVALYIPIFPICRYRVIREGNSYRFLGKAPLRAGDKWHLAISLGVVAAFIIAGISADNASQSSGSNTGTYRGNDSSGYRVPTYANSALSAEKAAIESQRTQVQALEGEVEDLGREIERDRLLLDRSNEFERESFNAKIGRYNTLLEEAQDAEAAFNQRVNSYNAKLRGYSSPPVAQSSPAFKPNGSGYRATNSASAFLNAPRVNASSTATATTVVPDRAVKPAAPVLPTPPSQTRRIAIVKISGNDTLNLRAQASANSAIIGTLRNGENVFLDTAPRAVNYEKGVTVNWQRIITFSGLEGWVNVDYLTNPYQ